MKPYATESLVRVAKGPYRGMTGRVQYRNVNGCYGVAMTCRAEVLEFQAHQLRVEAITPPQTAAQWRAARLAEDDAADRRAA